MAAASELGKVTGRPPFGFDVGPEGYPSPNSDFETALVILDRLDRGDSKRSVANSAVIVEYAPRVFGSIAEALSAPLAHHRRQQRTVPWRQKEYTEELLSSYDACHSSTILIITIA